MKEEIIFQIADAGKDHCNKTVDIYEDISNPKLTPENHGKPLHCWYRFRSFRGTTPREWVLRIRFKKFKFGTLLNATECSGGFMQVFIHKIERLGEVRALHEKYV